MFKVIVIVVIVGIGAGYASWFDFRIQTMTLYSLLGII